MPVSTFYNWVRGGFLERPERTGGWRPSDQRKRGDENHYYLINSLWNSKSIEGWWGVDYYPQSDLDFCKRGLSAEGKKPEH